MNIVVLRGVLPHPPEMRELSSGSTLCSFDLSTATPEGTVAVPVAWFEPAANTRLDAGLEVVVLGTVRRRFFRAGGSVQSRTEVVADAVVRTTNRKGVERVLAQAEALVSGGA